MGNETDFAEVYREQVWHVYGFFAYRLSDKDAAEDLTQGTFERALRAWSRFDRRRASERTWLLAIARNLLIDYHRRYRPDPIDPADQRLSASAGEPEDDLAGSAELIDALSHLPDRDREILALRYGGDLTGPEIAALLGLSLSNVQQITSRALRRLRELIGESQALR